MSGVLHGPLPSHTPTTVDGRHDRDRAEASVDTVADAATVEHLDEIVIEPDDALDVTHSPATSHGWKRLRIPRLQH